MNEAERGFDGGRVVVWIYLIVVALAGVMGYVIGIVRPKSLDPELFGVLALPPTPAGMVVYGTVTVGTILGVLLALVAVVSDRYDDVDV